MQKVYSKIVFVWDEANRQYIADSSQTVYRLYSGPMALLCGPTSAQQSILGEQQQLFQQAGQQASSIFGDSSQVFGDLMKTFAPTVAAGPSQQGFSAGELSNLDSQAITDTGQAYRNAKTAVGESEAAQGGGNTQTAGGAKVGTDLGIATSSAAQTSNLLSGIQQQNYATGRQNYDLAVQGLAGAPNVFGASSNALNTATNSGNAAANEANTIQQQDNSWVNAAIGAAGSVAGAAATAGFNQLGSGSNAGDQAAQIADSPLNYGNVITESGADGPGT